MINYWSFDGNANDVVGSADMINGSNATFTNDRNNASFSAVDLNFGYYTIPSINYSYGKTWTVSFWIFHRSAGYKSYPRVIDFINAPDNDNIFIYLNQNSSTICSCIHRSFVRYHLCSNSDFKASIWNHVSFAKNLSQMSLYINGKFQTSSVTTDNNSKLLNGSNFFGKSNGNANDIINAKIDDLKIFDIAMNSSRIIQNMNLTLKRI